MERVQRQNGESENSKRTAQAKFTALSREGEMARRIDTSPAMVAQRKKLQGLFGGVMQRHRAEPLQHKFEMPHNNIGSPHGADAIGETKQMKNLPDSDKTAQLSTIVYSEQDQDYSFGSKKMNVGKVMEVGLDPNDMEQGQSANLNTSQNEMMDAIRGQWGISGGGLVKGHLWNDNLGGSAMNYNLYPITKAANSDHLGFVENLAKHLVWGRQPIYYSVEVDAVPDITEPKAEFDCEVREWDPQTEKIGNLVSEPVTITSDLRDVGAYNEAYETYTGNPADRQKRPRKPKWAKNPKTRVGELTKQELWERENQK